MDQRSIEDLFERNADMRLLELRHNEPGKGAPPNKRTASSFGAESIMSTTPDVETEKAPQLRVTIAAAPASGVIPGAVVGVAVDVFNDGTAPAPESKLLLAIPIETEFRSGTLRIDGREPQAPEQLFSHGLPVPRLPGGTSSKVTFQLAILPGVNMLYLQPRLQADGVPVVGTAGMSIKRNTGGTSAQPLETPRPFYELDPDEAAEVAAQSAEPIMPPVLEREPEPVLEHEPASHEATEPLSSRAESRDSHDRGDGSTPLTMTKEPLPVPNTATEPLSSRAESRASHDRGDGSTPLTMTKEPLPVPNTATEPLSSRAESRDSHDRGDGSTPLTMTNAPLLATDALAAADALPVLEGAPVVEPLPKLEPKPKTPAKRMRKSTPTPEPEAEPKTAPAPKPRPSKAKAAAAAAPAEERTIRFRTLGNNDIALLDRLFSADVPGLIAHHVLISSIACSEPASGAADGGYGAFLRSDIELLGRALVHSRMGKATQYRIVQSDLDALSLAWEIPPPPSFPAPRRLRRNLRRSEWAAVGGLMQPSERDTTLRARIALLALAGETLEGVDGRTSDECTAALSAYRSSVLAWLVPLCVASAGHDAYVIPAPPPGVDTNGRKLVATLKLALTS